MTYFTDTNIKFSDSSSLDAFERQRVSEPFTLFDSQLEYNDQPLLWETALTGSGTAPHSINNSAVNMSVTTANGDKVIRQSRQYIRYQPGKSQTIFLTGVFGLGHANNRKRLGLFDDENGIFFEEINGAISIIRRSFTTGSVVDTPIPQASWNQDVMDGNGVSGITLVPADAQLFVIDLAWLGVGRVRVGLIVAGQIHYVHEFLHANQTSGVYMSTANLPIRYEIENTGIISTPLILKQICSSVISEGGFERAGFPFVASSEITPVTVGTTLTPIISIRPKLVFSGSVNRALVIPRVHTIVSASQILHFEVIKNGVLPGSPGTAWNSVNANSVVEYDVSAGTVSGGEVVATGYVTANASAGGAPASEVNEILSKVFLTLNIAGTDSTTYTIAARSVTATTDVYASITWAEYY